MKSAKTFEAESTKKNIKALRGRINQREADQIKVFTRYKVITYGTIFLLPPYGIYRLFRKDSPFTYSERLAQSMVLAVYVFVLASYWLK